MRMKNANGGRVLLVSACLLGIPCRYSNDSRPNAAVKRLGERYTLLPICPEVLGGLPTPRAPAERIGELVLNAEGRDVTEQFRRGAEEALRIARKHGVTTAILKARSPSCGKGERYDGTFSGKTVPMDGVTAELFRRNGICIYTEEELEAGIPKLDGESQKNDTET